MPKIKVLQGNFSSGELSPKALGRVDIARYPNAAKSMVNVLPRTLGGAEKRDGTEYIAETKNMAKVSRLVPYIISQDLAYMLELGEYYARIYKVDGTAVLSGAVPYEVVTPYTEAQVGTLDYSQGEEAMWIFHNDLMPNIMRTFAADNWNCQEPIFTALPFAEQGIYPSISLTLSSNTVGTGRTMTASAAVFLASDVNRAIIWNAGIAIVTAFTDTTHVTVEVKSIFESASIPVDVWNLDSSPQTDLTPSASTPVGASITLTLAANGWRSGDVGKYVRINSGLVEITSYTSALICNGTIIQALTSTAAAPGLSWTLEDSVWNTRNGFPRTGTFHEQRLICAGTVAKPQTIFGSRTGEPYDFTGGAADDDGFSFTLAGDDNQINQIEYLVSARNLLALTFGGEFTITGGVEKPITATNVQIKAQSPYGSNPVRPVQVGKETLFVQRAGRKIRALGFSSQDDGYKAPDLTVLAEHLSAGGISAMAFQQETDPIVWVVLNNGKLISVTFDRDLDIIAWAHHVIDGAVESIAVMPDGAREQVWMIIRREVNGAQVRYVERLQDQFFPIYGTASPSPTVYPPGDEPFNWGFQLDCALIRDDAAGKTVWTDAAHLEGKTIRCIADGVDMPPMIVAAGTFTLPRAAYRVHFGLFFQPSVTLLTPEIQGGNGSVQGDAMSVNQVILRVDQSIGLTVEGDQAMPGRTFGVPVLDLAPEPYSGDVDITTLGWSNGRSEITISQDDPFPFHLLAVIRTLTINGG